MLLFTTYVNCERIKGAPIGSIAHKMALLKLEKLYFLIIPSTFENLRKTFRTTGLTCYFSIKNPSTRIVNRKAGHSKGGD